MDVSVRCFGLSFFVEFILCLLEFFFLFCEFCIGFLVKLLLMLFVNNLINNIVVFLKF